MDDRQLLRSLADPQATVTLGDALEVGPGLGLSLAPSATLAVAKGCVLRRDVEIRVDDHATVELGPGVKIDRGVRILATSESRISIGAGSAIGLGSVLNGGDDITIGDQSLVSGYVYLLTSIYRFAAGRPIREQGYDHAPIRLSNDVWLGTHVTVLPGCTRADGTVIGGTAVLRTSTSRDKIWAGVSARCVGQRS